VADSNIRHVRQGEQFVLKADRIFAATGHPAIENGVIIIADRRIAYLGPSDNAPVLDRAVPLSFGDSTILPGLIDMHAHPMGWAGSVWDEHRLWLGADRNLRVFRAAANLRHWLSAGYTTIRDMAVPGPSIALKQAVESAVIEGPRMVIGIIALGQTGGHADSLPFPYEWQRDRWIRPGAQTMFPAGNWVDYGGGAKGLMVDGVDSCRKAVRAILRQGADFIKLFLDHLGDEDMLEFSDDEIRVVVDESHRRGLHVAAHTISAAAVRRALRFGIDTIEHGSPLLEDSDFDELATSSSTLVPGLANAYWLMQEERSAVQDAVGDLRDAYEPGRQMIARAIRAGVKIAPGSGIGAFDRGRGGYAVDLELLVELGMTPELALEAQTRVAARACKMDDQLGTLEVGKLADMIVVRGNPLEDIALMRTPGPSEVFTTMPSPDEWNDRAVVTAGPRSTESSTWTV
jgi:imidazolonepropionase-like amidohydrolase